MVNCKCDRNEQFLPSEFAMIFVVFIDRKLKTDYVCVS